MEGMGFISLLFPAFLMWHLGFMTRMENGRLAPAGGVPGAGDRTKGQNFMYCSLRNVPQTHIPPLNWC